MKTLSVLLQTAFVVLLTSVGRAQDNQTTRKGVDLAIIAAYESLGATYGSLGEYGQDGFVRFTPAQEAAKTGLPGFHFFREPKKKLPDAGVSFGLLFQGPMTDAGLKQLAGAKNVVTLELNGRQVTDVGLKDLTHLKKLATLGLSGTKITDVGLRELAHLKNLSILDLSRTAVTDKGLKHLAGLEDLSALILRQTHVTGEGLPDFARLKNLTFLDLSVTDVKVLNGVAQLKNLKTLGLNGTRLTNKALKGLKGLQNSRVTLSKFYRDNGLGRIGWPSESHDTIADSQQGN